MEHIIINDLCPEELFALRKLLGWKTIELDQLTTALKNTMCKVCIKTNDEIIACGRIVGDYSCKGVLSDILVNPKYQHLGFGKTVVCNLLEQVENNLKEGQVFQVEATPTFNNRDFYIKCGLKYKPENQDGVYIWIKK